MRKQVYVFDEYISSQKNGIGSFLKDFCYCMGQLDANVCLFTFNANVKELTIQRSEQGEIERMLFPCFPAGEFTHNAEIVVRLLRLYIRDSSDNIFFVNHSPCEKLVEELKRDYSQSKVVFTIHDLGWTSRCMGDADKFKQLVGATNDIQEDVKYILDLYAKEVRVYGLVDRVVCLSRDTYHLLQTVYSLLPEKIFLIPNGMKDSSRKDMRHSSGEELRKELLIPVGEKIVLYAGRPTMQKGIYVLLNAFHSILKNDSNVRLVIIGSDNSNRIENLINISSSFATHVSFLGLINKKELEKWYAVADIGVIPSYYEQCPYVGIEMMMHGLPVVASDGFGLRNMFQDRVNALVAPIGEREDTEEFSRNLAKAIDELLSSEELRKTLGRNAQETYHSCYSEKQMLKGYKDLLASLD